ncbi:MAG: GNAT family N-acetyltransferase [Chloroflexota bacterium]
MNNKNIIRIATEADIDTIVSLNHALFQEDAGQRDPTMNVDWALEHGHEYFASLLQQGETHSLIAEDDEKALGYLIGYLRDSSSLRPINQAELESMFVVAEARSSGIGAELVSQFKEWCKKQGVERISVTAFVANERATAFYQRHGFEPRNVTLETNLESNLDLNTTRSFPERVAAELAGARSAHAPMYSLHEGYAVLLEEVDELWDEIKAKVRNQENLEEETVQIAAMCQRLFEDVIQGM